MENDDAATTPAEQVVVVRFAVSDPSYPFVGASKLGRIALERMFPREDGHYAEFFNLRGSIQTASWSWLTRTNGSRPA